MSAVRSAPTSMGAALSTHATMKAAAPETKNSTDFSRLVDGAQSKHAGECNKSSVLPNEKIATSEAKTEENVSHLVDLGQTRLTGELHEFSVPQRGKVADSEVTSSEDLSGLIGAHTKRDGKPDELSSPRHGKTVWKSTQKSPQQVGLTALAGDALAALTAAPSTIEKVDPTRLKSVKPSVLGAKDALASSDRPNSAPLANGKIINTLRNSLVARTSKAANGSLEVINGSSLRIELSNPAGISKMGVLGARPTLRRQLLQVPTSIASKSITVRKWAQGQIHRHSPKGSLQPTPHVLTDSTLTTGVTAVTASNLLASGTSRGGLDSAAGGATAPVLTGHISSSGTRWRVTSVQVVPHQLVAARIKPPFNPRALEARVAQFQRATQVTISVPSTMSDWTSSLSHHQDELASALSQAGMPAPSVRVTTMTLGTANPGFTFNGGGQSANGGGQPQSGSPQSMHAGTTVSGHDAHFSDDTSSSDIGTRW